MIVRVEAQRTTETAGVMWFFLGGDDDGVGVVLLWQFIGWDMPYPRTATFSDTGERLDRG